MRISACGQRLKQYLLRLRWPWPLPLLRFPPAVGRRRCPAEALVAAVLSLGLLYRVVYGCASEAVWFLSRLEGERRIERVVLWAGLLVWIGAMGLMQICTPIYCTESWVFSRIHRNTRSAATGCKAIFSHDIFNYFYFRLGISLFTWSLKLKQFENLFLGCTPNHILVCFFA
jgi:hypothetical protein